jgi:hypothetical protein
MGDGRSVTRAVLHCRSMSPARLLVLALVVVLPLTAFLVFAAGDVLVPHPWSKHSQRASPTVVRLPSGITAPPGAALVLPLLGALIAATPPAAASIALQPPFVPPRV